MKTGEEKFDKEIQQKLNGSSIEPPVEFFDKIVPPENKRKRFLWLWTTSLALLISISAIIYFSDDKNKHVKSIQNIFTSKQNKSNEDFSDNSQIKKSITKNSTKVNETNKFGSLNANDSKKNNPESNENRQDLKSNESAYNQNKKRTGNKINNSKYIENRNRTLELAANSYSSVRPDKNDEIKNIDYSPLLTIKGNNLPLQEIKVLKADKTQFNSHEASPFTFEFFGGALINYNFFKNGNDDTTSNRLISEMKSLNDKNTGLTLGFKVLYKLKNKLSISAGLNYSSRKENYKFEFTEYYQEMELDTHIYYILFPFTPPQMITEIDTSIVNKSKVYDVRHDINFSDITFSTGLHYSIPFGNFILDPYIEVKCNILTITKGKSNFNPEHTENNDGSAYNKSIRMGLGGGLQLGYNLNEKITIFASSEYHYYLQPITKSGNFYKQQLTSLGLLTGFRYNIFKKQATKNNSSGSDIVNNKL